MRQAFDSKSTRQYYAIKVHIPPTQSQTLFFDTLDEKNKWVILFHEIMGYSNVLDYYEFEGNLGKG